MKKAACFVLVFTLLAGIISFSCFAENTGDYKVGDIVEFGTYPQTKVTDANTLKSLNALLKDDQWISYGYRHTEKKKTLASDFMRYADVSFDGKQYRAVVFDKYRPNYTSHDFDMAGAKHFQSFAGYKTDTVYWFAYEPIRWIVIDTENQLIVSRDILDSQPFDFSCYNVKEYRSGNTTQVCYGDRERTHLSTDYPFSTVHDWLNDDTGFSETAFTKAQFDLIEQTVLDDVFTTFDGVFSAKVFLLSVDQYRTYQDSDQLLDNCFGTDYAQCQGLDSKWKAVLASNDQADMWWVRNDPENNGAGTWGNGSHVRIDGAVEAYHHTNATTVGVRPAMRLKELKSDTSLKKVSSTQKVKAVNYKSEFDFASVFGAGTKDALYRSSDSEIATVTDSGFIRACGTGSVLITRITADENDHETKEVLSITIKYAWWQTLIRIFLLGFLWY